MVETFFQVEGLTKRFGGLMAVKDVSFQIGRDEIVGLIGPNGAGKTTLIHCILGILRPDSGKVIFKGKDHQETRLGSRSDGYGRYFPGGKTF